MSKATVTPAVYKTIKTLVEPSQVLLKLTPTEATRLAMLLGHCQGITFHALWSALLGAGFDYNPVDSPVYDLPAFDCRGLDSVVVKE